MPPKPRPRKASTASSKGSPAMIATKVSPAKDVAMPPPPNPPAPKAILEPEMNALQGCLRNAIVKTGQVYQFYSDVSRLGVQGHAPNPPRSLVASLGREVEKYDQLCDAMESHLVRAIAVLERDINRERNRLKEAELAAKASEDLKNKENQDSVVPTAPSSPSAQQPVAVPGGDDVQTQLVPSMTPPSGALAPAHSGRRPSAISLSSLHRPAFPHKLDLSSTALKLDEAELLVQSALASPVTLAPKSARPTANPDFPPDFLEALASADASERHVDIDLTRPDPGSSSSGQGADPNAGNSADKPIELDLDMDVDVDIFGTSGSSNSNANTAVQDLISRARSRGLSASGGLDDPSHKDQDGIGMVLFGALSGTDEAKEAHEIFGSLHGPEQGGQSSQQDQSHPSGIPAASTSAPSPASILASFSVGGSNTGDIPHPPAESGLGTPFDLGSLDLSNMSHFDSNFDFGNTGSTDFSEMEALFNLGHENDSVEPKERPHET